MAAETNKNSALQDRKTEVVATTSAGDSAAFNRSKKPLVFLLVIIVLAAVGWLLVSKLHIGQKVYAQAAGHKIYQRDIQDLVGKNKKISDHDAATVLADSYLTQAMAKEQGLTVTDKDLQAKYGSSVNTQKKQNQYAYQYQVNQLYFDKLRSHNKGIYKGKLLVAQFNRYIPYQSPMLNEDKAADPNIGNPSAIAADKAYASQLINNLYKQVESGKISFDQAINTERNDPRVGEKAYPTLSHSGPFDTSSQYISRNGLLEVPSARKEVQKIKPGETSKPFVVSVSDSVYSGSTAESYYLVVHMDSVSGKPSGMDFEQYLAQAKKQLGYKVNV